MVTGSEIEDGLNEFDKIMQLEGKF